MAATRKVEIFSAGCAVCEQAIEMVRNGTRSSCEIIVHDMKDTRIAERAKSLGIRSVPAVVIDGKRLVSDNLSKPHLAKSPLPAAVVSVTLCFVVKDSAGQKLVIQI